MIETIESFIYNIHWENFTSMKNDISYWFNCRAIKKLFRILYYEFAIWSQTIKNFLANNYKYSNLEKWIYVLLTFIVFFSIFAILFQNVRNHFISHYIFGTYLTLTLFIKPIKLAFFENYFIGNFKVNCVILITLSLLICLFWSLNFLVFKTKLYSLYVKRILICFSISSFFLLFINYSNIVFFTQWQFECVCFFVLLLIVFSCRGYLDFLLRKYIKIFAFDIVLLCLTISTIKGFISTSIYLRTSYPFYVLSVISYILLAFYLLYKDLSCEVRDSLKFKEK